MWDTGPDAITGYDATMATRRRALQQFSIAVLPDARQTGELEARLVPVYLLHRYQVEAVARLVAGGVYEFATIGDVRSGASTAGVQVVPVMASGPVSHITPPGWLAPAGRESASLT